MATFSVQLPSGSSNGKFIQVAATSSPGDTITTAVNSVTDYDEVYIWACNIHSSQVVLTLQWGGTTAADEIITAIPPQQGLLLIVPGGRINNNLAIKAYADTTNVINILCNINRILS